MKKILKRIIITLFVLLIYKIGLAITIPGVDTSLINVYISSGNFLSTISMVTGGSLESFSIFALGVGPYINASIVIQLLGLIFPTIKDWREEGNKGREKLDKLTKYTTLVIGILQAIMITYMFQNSYGILEDGTVMGYINTIVLMLAGTSCVLWLADVITAYGLGNGTSVIIFAGIVTNLPYNFKTVFDTFVTEQNNVFKFVMYCVVFALLIVMIIFEELSERRILIQQSNRVVSKAKGDFNYIPLKANSGGVMPVIYASIIISLPSTLANFFSESEVLKNISETISLSTIWGMVLYAILIVLFTFVYTAFTIEPKRMAENLQKNGTYIPGIRPGRETKDYINKVLYSITTLGAIFLLIIALLPYVMAKIEGLSSSVALGGTGMIIAVGVAIEIGKNIKTLMVNNSYEKYKGF